MKRILTVLKTLGAGLAGALWLYTAPMIPNQPLLKVMLYVFGVLTVGFSLATLVMEAGWVKSAASRESRER